MHQAAISRPPFGLNCTARSAILRDARVVDNCCVYATVAIVIGISCVLAIWTVGLRGVVYCISRVFAVVVIPMLFGSIPIVVRFFSMLYVRTVNFVTSY